MNTAKRNQRDKEQLLQDLYNIQHAMNGAPLVPYSSLNEWARRRGVGHGHALIALNSLQEEGLIAYRGDLIWLPARDVDGRILKGQQPPWLITATASLSQPDASEEPSDGSM